MIKAESLAKSYRDIKAVSDLSLSIRPGEIYALLGPNGAGKSTTLRMLAGVLEPDSGNIEVCGYALRKEPLAYKASVGFLSEDTNLYERMTAKELFQFFGGLHGLKGAYLTEAIDRVVAKMGIEDYYKKQVRKLSSGQRQRVNLARILLHDPDVLLLDEATANLDIIGRRFVMDTLVEQSNKGKTIILSTHIMSEAETVCNRIGLIYGGGMIDEGPKDELLSRMGTDTLTEAFFMRMDKEKQRVGSI